MATKNQDAKKEGKTEPAVDASFETAIGRLESIVEEMESDQLPLEEMLLRYEEGLKLVKVCGEKLQAAEKRIEIITREAGGKPKTTPFEPGQEAAPAPSLSTGAPAASAAGSPASEAKLF